MSSPKPATCKHTLAYATIVAVGYAVDLTCYVALAAMGVHLYIAYFAAFLTGATFNVAMLRRYFAAGRFSLAADLALTFGTNGAVIVLAFGVYAFLIAALAMPHITAKILSNVFSVLINYYTRRRYF